MEDNEESGPGFLTFMLLFGAVAFVVYKASRGLLPVDYEKENDPWDVQITKTEEYQNVMEKIHYVT